MADCKDTERLIEGLRRDSLMELLRKEMVKSETLQADMRSMLEDIEMLRKENERLLPCVHPKAWNQAQERIAELEAIRDAAANLVRAEGWQIERDNLWDTLHDLIDADGERR